MVLTEGGSSGTLSVALSSGWAEVEDVAVGGASAG